MGVLVEKALTTPAQYPLSLNAVTTGCNQKSNRFPQMQLEDEDVEESLDRMREAGAVGLMQLMPETASLPCSSTTRTATVLLAPWMY